MINYVNILGIKVHLITVPKMLDYVNSLIINKEQATITYSNIQTINLAYRSTWLSQFLNSAALNYCDGTGVVLGARILGYKIPGRITFADAILPFSEFCQEKGYSIYLLGSKPGVADLAAKELLMHFPNLLIVGTYHGFFDKSVNSNENKLVIQQINASKANILLTGFGTPIQENWLLENRNNLDVDVVMCEGALFDFISGEIPRAPRWMTDHGLEWLGRLVFEPRRMWRRYLLGNPIFLWRVLMQRLGIIKC